MALNSEEWPTGAAEYGYINDLRDLLVKAGGNIVDYCFSRMTEVLS
jgi:hypothetical protein